MSITLEHVNYVYSPETAYEIHALKDINLEIGDGQFIGLIGHTGSGKSTLVQHLNGLVKAPSGRSAARWGLCFSIRSISSLKWMS